MFPAPAGINRSPGVFFPGQSVFPAPAGINRAGIRFLRNTTTCSRASGINRFSPISTFRCFGVPRASGDKPREPVLTISRPRVFPAPAGINRLKCGHTVLMYGCSPRQRDKPFRLLLLLLLIRVPRASGDKPNIYLDASDVESCSPRQRG